MQSHPLSQSDFALYTERHDRVDNVVVVLLQCLDSLLPADGCLGHDKLDILCLEASVVNLLAVILLFLLLLGLAALDSLALVAVVVAGVVTGGSLLCCELLSCRSLCLRVEVLNLGLAEDAVLVLGFQSLLRAVGQRCLHVGVA